MDWEPVFGEIKEVLWSVLPALGKILLVLVLTKFVLSLARTFVQKLFFPERRRTTMDPQKAKTLETLLQSGLRYLIYFIAGITILSTLGVKTESVLASAGIVGIAIGFGAQSLVQDVVTGFFIIFEDQFIVGDYIETAGLSGFVEEMGLRVTKLRDFNGVVHILPNSKISNVTNHSRGNRTAMVEIAVPYTADVMSVQALLEETNAELAKQLDAIVEGPKILGIVRLSPAEMVWRIWARTQPMKHWSVEREMRKALKMALDKAGIEPPYPRTILRREGSEQ
ncbi:MAG: mechanosensitive ion channel family protein [Firmicutes bacterium]|nr:mechanosensitive ion channel family protein [Bacillota bacterium]